MEGVTRALLVVGSPTLADRDGAEAWALPLIRAALDGAALLIVDDEGGPARWAVEANADARPVQRYVGDGYHAGQVLTQGRMGEWIAAARWASPGALTTPERSNRAMVDALVTLRDDGAEVAALVLLDGAPGGMTYTAEDMATGCRLHSIPVRREVWR